MAYDEEFYALVEDAKQLMAERDKLEAENKELKLRELCTDACPFKTFKDA